MFMKKRLKNINIKGGNKPFANWRDKTMREPRGQELIDRYKKNSCVFG